ncbi:hypothetical protein Hanom_Chr06g00538091 [Helianthus anomalus]
MDCQVKTESWETVSVEELIQRMRSLHEVINRYWNLELRFNTMTSSSHL